jgi:hypothetical protein
MREYSSAVRPTCVSLARIGYNAIGDQENADGVTRTFACACWLLSDVAPERNCRCVDRKLCRNEVAHF